MSEKTQSQWLGATLFSGLLIGAGFVIGPAWQIHDDTYYAMLTEGYGLVNHPVAAIPHMHPVIGSIVSLIQSTGIRYPYAWFLVFCIALASCTVSYRLFKDRSSAGTWFLVAAGILPFLLSLQYTAVSGLLVASTAVLWLSDGSRQSIMTKEWILGGLLLLIAALFRVEMLILVAAVLLPVLFWSFYASSIRNRKLIYQFLLVSAAVIICYLLLTFINKGEQMGEFNRQIFALAKLMDYAYLKAIIHFNITLPDGITRNDIELLDSWFFGDRKLVDPTLVNQLVNSVPFSDVLKIRYWDAVSKFKSWPSTIHFWYLLATLWLAFFSRIRCGILLGIAIFIMLSVLTAMLLKPFPERVAGGVVCGLFMLSVITRHSIITHSVATDGLSAAFRKTASYFAILLLTPVAFNIIEDRALLQKEKAQWAEISFFMKGEQVYSFVGQLPLRGGYWPFHIDNRMPKIKFLGSMYLLPEIVKEERSTGCGGFLDCLAMGKRTIVTASDSNIATLRKLLLERFGKQLNIDETISRSGLSLYVLSVEQDSN